MGNAASSMPFASLKTNMYMFIALQWDAFLIGFAEKPELDAIRNSITQYWSKGIQKEEPKYVNVNNPNAPAHCYKFKLNGYPFTIGGDKHVSIEARKMCADILSSLYNLGWKLLVSSDLSRTVDRGTWIFQKQNHAPDAGKFFTIGLSDFDKLQINDCPENLQGVIRGVVSQYWTKGIQEESTYPPSTYQIKLKGNPWGWVNKQESCASRLMIKMIIQTLTGYQWLLYGNSNLKSTADTLFFRHVPTLQGPIDFLMVSLNRNDRLRFVNVPDGIIASIQETVGQCWLEGIQEVIDTRPECYELKLKGNPWWATGQEAIFSRLLITKILERLATVGYYITAGLDISRKDNDKSLLLFQQGAPSQAAFMCVSLNDTDKIRLINAPANVIESCRLVISGWVLGLLEETNHYSGVSYQAKLKGNPWSAISTGEGAHGRALLLRLLENLTFMGWRLVCSADVSSKFIHRDKGTDYPIDVHSWYLMYDHTMLMQQQQQPQQAPQFGFQQNLYPSIDMAPPPTYEEAWNS